MESEEKLIIEEAPPDTAAYEEGTKGKKDKNPPEESGDFSF